MQTMLTLSPEDAEILRSAHAHLEHPSLAARLTNFVGLPIERGLKLLPKTWYENLQRGTRGALESALGWAIASLESAPAAPTKEGYHKLLSDTSGTLGGFFGLPAVLAELPVSTTITLRAIVNIARDEGEDLIRREYQRIGSPGTG